MNYRGHFEEKRHKNRKNAWKRIRIILLSAVLLAGSAVVWGIGCYNKMLGKMNIVTLDKDLYETYTEEMTLPEKSDVTLHPEQETPETEIIETSAAIKSEDIINILVVGQAYRAGEESRMADTTVLVTVNTYDGTVTLSSVLRDAYVSLPAYKSHTEGRNKFNVCYNLGYSWEGIEGAMAYTNLTMLRNFGVEIDHNIEISFEGFIKLIDYMGGVEIELTEAEADYLNGDNLYVLYDMKPGMQHLDGMAALSYARMRKADGDGDSDIKRTERQRKLMGALAMKIRGLSLKELQGVADELLPLITTTMTPADIADVLLRMLPHIRDLKIEGGTLPVETTYWGDMVDIYGDGFQHSVLRFDIEQNKRLVRAFTEAAGIS